MQALESVVDQGGASASVDVERSAFALLAALVREPLSSVPQQAYNAGMVVTRALGRMRIYLTGPELIQEAFVRQADALTKSEQGRVLKPALGTGLLTAEGADWRWQRRTLSPGFAHARLQSLVPAMIAAAEATRDALLARSPGTSVDIGRETTRVTLRIVGDTMLACANGLDASRIESGIAAFLKPAPWVIALGIVGAPDWTPYPGRRQSAAAARELRDEVTRTVALRRSEADAEGENDLLALLLAARDPDGGRALTDVEITDNVVTFVTAGHETTSGALTWALHLLSLHPDAAIRMRAEIETVAGDSPLTAEHVAQLAYTRQVVNETLRIYPSAPITSRTTSKSMELGGRTIPAGSVIILPIYAVHHHRGLWDRPEIFDPARFAPDPAKARHRYAFMPFGVGPRICIGSAFAMLEAVAILAVLVRALDFAPAGPAPEPIARLTLRPRTPVMLRVSPAQRTTA